MVFESDKELRRSLDDLLLDLNVYGTAEELDLEHLQKLVAQAHAWLWDLRELLDSETRKEIT